jgi:hypothetical protein
MQAGKQVIVTWSKIRAVGRIVKHLPVELLKCEQLYAVARCHGEALHQMSTFHAFCSEWPYAVSMGFQNTFMMFSWSLVAWLPPSALLSCPRKQVPSAKNICLNFTSSFSEYVFIECFDRSLISAITNKTQVLSPVTHAV